MKRKLKWLIVLAIVSSIGFGVYFLNGALPIGTGYSAKYICSQVFLADRDPELVFEKEVKPTHLLFQLVNPKVNYENKTVTSKAFGLWKPMTAVYREGCGCTLAVDASQDELRDQAKQIHLPELQRTEAPWPSGSMVDLEILPEQVDKDKIKIAIANAFEEPGPETMRNTQAIVVVLGNQIIAEKYAPGFTKDTPILGWSMSKSVTNALVGILVKDQALDIHSAALVEAWQAPGDPRNGITLDMMLRMSTGLEFEESYAPFKDATTMLYASKSMAAFAAKKPLKVDPDSQWYYSSGTTNMIAKIVTDKVGGNLALFHKFSRERLFHKIKAFSAVIEPDASGSFVGSSYMFATARDWARFGLLLKNDGVWDKVRILPQDWVTYSTRPTPKAPMGQYGAHFWLNSGAKGNPANRKFPSLPRDLYYCGGFNGQIVAIIPSRNMVVVRLGVTHDDSWDHETFIGQVLDSIQ
jgi:CubicO group peptidase (beta-lactamase class C family)